MEGDQRQICRGWPSRIWAAVKKRLAKRTQTNPTGLPATPHPVAVHHGGKVRQQGHAVAFHTCGMGCGASGPKRSAIDYCSSPLTHRLIADSNRKESLGDSWRCVRRVASSGRPAPWSLGEEPEKPPKNGISQQVLARTSVHGEDFGSLWFQVAKPHTGRIFSLSNRTGKRVFLKLLAARPISHLPCPATNTTVDCPPCCLKRNTVLQLLTGLYSLEGGDLFLNCFSGRTTGATCDTSLRIS